MKSLMNLFIFSVTSAVFVSCQTIPYEGRAREVKRKPSEGGIIALTAEHRTEDRMKADEKMKSNCPNGTVKILEEGEVAVGQTTVANSSQDHRQSTQRKAGVIFGMPIMAGQAAGTDTSMSSTVTQIKEWQISYECASSSSKRKSTH